MDDLIREQREGTTDTLKGSLGNQVDSLADQYDLPTRTPPTRPGTREKGLEQCRKGGSGPGQEGTLVVAAHPFPAYLPRKLLRSCHDSASYQNQHQNHSGTHACRMFGGRAVRHRRSSRCWQHDQAHQGRQWATSLDSPGLGDHGRFCRAHRSTRRPGDARVVLHCTDCLTSLKRSDMPSPPGPARWGVSLHLCRLYPQWGCTSGPQVVPLTGHPLNCFFI